MPPPVLGFAESWRCGRSSADREWVVFAALERRVVATPEQVVAALAWEQLGRWRIQTFRSVLP